MKAVSVFEFRKTLASYLDTVERTESPLVVNRFGKPVAVVVPYTKSMTKDPVSYFGFLGKGPTGEKFVNRIRRTSAEVARVARLRKGT